MVNVTKIKELAKAKGIKIGYICEQLGVNHTYLANVASGKNTMSEERIYHVAQILGTSLEYLVDITDDPDPRYMQKLIQTTQEKLVSVMANRASALSSDDAQTLLNVLEQSDEDFAKTLAVLKAMQGK
ncbi:MAG: helix-turn-helix domain-containing protein [Eubacteriales bacterium]